MADTYIHCYPNAGLPNPLNATGFDETPDITSSQIYEMAELGLVNIVGGCCGTTPEHIRAIAEVVSGVRPREVPEKAEGIGQIRLEVEQKEPGGDFRHHCRHEHTTFAGLETYAIQPLSLIHI